MPGWLRRPVSRSVVGFDRKGRVLYLNVTTVVRGRSYQELLTRAVSELQTFFGSTPYTITNASAEAHRENYADSNPAAVPVYIVDVSARSTNEI